MSAKVCTAGWYLVAAGYGPSRTSARRDFTRRLETASGGTEPRVTALRAYDVTMMIIEAVAGLGPEADRATVYERLSGARYEGLSGDSSFDADGEYTGSGPELFQVTDGEFEELGSVEDYRD